MTIEDATPAQREAITTDAQDVLCIAGPGAGKTATVVARIQKLIEAGTHPGKIAILTFTNSAAREIENRIGHPFGKDPDLAPTPGVVLPPLKSYPVGFIGTLHSFALRMLKARGGPFGYGDRVSVISPDSAQDLLESKAKSLGCKAPLKDLVALKGKGNIKRATTLPEIVVSSYFADMKAAAIVDYDLILSEFLGMLTAGDFRSFEVQSAVAEAYEHLFVDEAQDSAAIDWKIYAALNVKNKFFVGDVDQSIYSWRGGDPSEMVRLSEAHGVKVVKLEENFRSRAEICAAANALIGHNRNRVPKKTVSVKGPGGGVSVLGPYDNEGFEIGSVSHEIRRVLGLGMSVAVLSRTNHEADAFRKTLAAASLPVVKREVLDLPRDWRLARAFVDLSTNPDNDLLAFFYLVALFEKKGASPADAKAAAHAARKAAQAAGKSLNRANCGVSRLSEPANAVQALSSSEISKEAVALALDKFRELPAGATMIEFAASLEDVREHVKESKEEGAINVLTVHGAKGREFDAVFLVGFEDENFPGQDVRRDETGIEEARRLAFVAITRARERLFLSTASSRVTKWKAIVPRKPSRFLKEMLP